MNPQLLAKNISPEVRELLKAISLAGIVMVHLPEQKKIILSQKAVENSSLRSTLEEHLDKVRNYNGYKIVYSESVSKTPQVVGIS